MTFHEVCEKYGHAHDKLAVGDKLLLEGSNNDDRYVFLCEVIRIDGDNARLRALHTYYPSGAVWPRTDEMDRPIGDCKASILTLLQEDKKNDELLAEQWRKWSK